MRCFDGSASTEGIAGADGWRKKWNGRLSTLFGGYVFEALRLQNDI